MRNDCIPDCEIINRNMAPKRKSKRTTSNTSNKKSRVENEEGTLTDQQYETLYKYYCENWYQKNVESGGGTLRRKRQPPRMKSMTKDGMTDIHLNICCLRWTMVNTQALFL